MANDVDPHSMLRTTTQACQVHNKHIPESRMNHRHHIWPLGEGGPDIEDNIVVCCPTGHYNIHDLLQQYRMLMGDVPYATLRRYSHGERRFAELGYKRMTRKEM